jgi:phage N-6-adenine-methyltransferase
MNINNNSTTPLKEKDYWQTPWWLIRQLESMCHVEFILDACATDQTKKALLHFSEKEDALSLNWADYFFGLSNSTALYQKNGAVWCNPPFSQMALWIDKNIEESQKGVPIFMCHADTPDRNWFQKIEAHCFMQYVPDGRINYLLPDGSKPENNVPFPSCISVFNGWHNDGVKRVRFEREQKRFELVGEI